MRLAILIFVSFSLLSCRKTLCHMTREDISKYYKVVRPSDSFYIDLWKYPQPEDQFLPKAVLDSIEVLKSKGYRLEFTSPMYYPYVDCNTCKILESYNIKASCYETK